MSLINANICFRAIRGFSFNFINIRVAWYNSWQFLYKLPVLIFKPESND